jgi:D-glycero-D-manno-heptose 1,7-bisphosphate phosphatase
MRRAVFLDRDGVLNRAIVQDGKPLPPRTVREIEILPGVPEAIQALKNAGYLTIVVTNQPDVATSKLQPAVAEMIGTAVKDACGIDEIRVCYHTDEDGCFCRKPKPGMLLQAADEHDLRLGESFMIGDRWRDIDAGKAAGCKTIWIRSDYAERLPHDADVVVESLAEAASVILAGKV